MKFCLLAATLVASVAGQTTLPDSDWRSKARVLTDTGILLEFRTGATGSPVPLSSAGTVTEFVTPIHRLIVDRDGRILFAYDVSAEWGTDRQTFRIRLMPLDRGYEDGIRKEGWFPRDSERGPDGRLPTFATARELPLVRAGEVVQVELLENPTTGMRVFDQLRASPGKQLMPVMIEGASENLSFSSVRLSVNGKPAGEYPATLIGQVAVLWIPNRGSFYLAVQPPRTLGYSPIARAAMNRLTWTWGNELYELTSDTNILSKSQSGAVWVYRRPDKPKMISQDAEGRLWIAVGRSAIP